MKNREKIAAAEEVVAHARSLGFEDARVCFTDNDIFFDTLEELAQDYGYDEPITASICIVLDDDLGFLLVGDPDDEDAEPQIEFAR